MKIFVVALLCMLLIGSVSAVEYTYYYSGNRLIASDGASGREYYGQDRLGTNRMVFATDGNSRGKYTSLPFGQVVEDTTTERFDFTGKEKDSTGLYYFGARYYDSDLGKFTTSDPVEDGLDYAYVNNNPMNYVDPDGSESVQKVVDDNRQEPLTSSRGPGLTFSYGYRAGSFRLEQPTNVQLWGNDKTTWNTHNVNVQYSGEVKASVGVSQTNMVNKDGVASASGDKQNVNYNTKDVSASVTVGGSRVRAEVSGSHSETNRNVAGKVIIDPSMESGQRVLSGSSENLPQKNSLSADVSTRVVSDVWVSNGAKIDAEGVTYNLGVDSPVFETVNKNGNALGVYASAQGQFGNDQPGFAAGLTAQASTKVAGGRGGTTLNLMWDIDNQKVGPSLNLFWSIPIN
jgi:RHS repeat-associated protein